MGGRHDGLGRDPQALGGEGKGRRASNGRKSADQLLLVLRRGRLAQVIDMLSDVDLASNSLDDRATHVAPRQRGGGNAPSHNAASSRGDEG
eukprot:8652316-Lingulodinium_polyedra.AAC.1